MQSLSIKNPHTYIIAGVFLLSAVLLPVVASAQSNNTTSTNNAGNLGKPKVIFRTEADCVATVKQIPLEKVRQFANRAIDTRIKALDNLSDSVNKRYDANNSAVDKKIKAKVDRANKKAKKAAEAKAKKDKTTPQTPPPFSAEASTHKTALLQEIAALKKTMTDSKAVVGSTNSSDVVAQELCKAVLNTRVYIYMKRKVQYQKRIDNLYNLNEANRVDYELIKAVAALLGSDAAALPASIPDPSALKAEIDALQAKLDAITITSVNEARSSDVKIADFWSEKMPEDSIKGVRAKIKDQDKGLRDVVRTINKLIRNLKK